MRDVIIIGSGPAGWTAALYAARANLAPLLFEGPEPGGQLTTTTEVENFPGFPKGIQGPELMQLFAEQAKRFGTEAVSENVSALTINPDGTFTVTAGKTDYQSKTVILSMGATARRLGLPSEKALYGKGVSACATCDGFFFKDKNVIIVGGGDSAMEEAQVLSQVSPDVILIHRRDEFRAQKATLDKVLSKKNVRFLYNTRVLDILGEQSVNGILLETSAVSPKQEVKTLPALITKFGGQKRSHNQWVLPRNGVFVAIGLVPNTQKFTGLDLDSHGYVKRFEEKDGNGVYRYFTKTNVDGVFTAGDVHDARYKQAVTAAGFGAMAAIDVERWLAEHE